MFTGLITELGVIRNINLHQADAFISIDIKGREVEPISVGDSIAVCGVCLSVTSVSSDNRNFRCDILHETLERTNLTRKKLGDIVNLERALKVGGRLGGHMVLGHVDYTGYILDIRRAGRDYVLRIEIQQPFKKYIVYKGSVAVEGVSLTVADKGEDWFDIHIIPFTWTHTNFHQLKVGELVNVETDIIGKYVESIINNRTDKSKIDWSFLLEKGMI